MRYWSALFSFVLLAFLAGCGSEQFGTTPQTKTDSAQALKVFRQASCSNRTLVKPAVDVLYLVDNSSSTYYVSSQIKTAIKNTIDSISNQFDYRIIGAPLMSDETDNFQILAKTPSSLNSIYNSKKVTSESQFTFFSNLASGPQENGSQRIFDFITAHQNNGLFRQDSYLFVVLISNGRDKVLETQTYPQTVDPTTKNTANYDTIFQSLKGLKSYYNSKQFRMFSLTATTSCKSGWLSSLNSYVSLSKDLYLDHTTPALNDQSARTHPDHYNLCGSSIDSVFNSVNATIKQVVLPHKYKYWPITFTSDNNLDVSKIKVYKQSTTSSSMVLMDSTKWNYLSNPSLTTYNTRIAPSAGEPTNARHLIEFTASNEIIYPECVSITSSTNLEYFQYIVLDQPAQPTTITVKINGSPISQSSTDGWSYMGYASIPNVKVSHNGYSDQPPANRTGYMIKLNGSANYYKSGDDVEVYYLPDEL